MCSFVILLLSNEMQMSVRRFSAIPHLRERTVIVHKIQEFVYVHKFSDFKTERSLE